jgi:hypothetical protein
MVLVAMCYPLFLLIPPSKRNPLWVRGYKGLSGSLSS